MKKRNIVILLLIAIILIAFVPPFALKDAEFGGSDDAGSTVVEEVDSELRNRLPVLPLIENILGGELPGEVESLLLVFRPESAWESLPSAWDVW